MHERWLRLLNKKINNSQTTSQYMGFTMWQLKLNNYQIRNFSQFCLVKLLSWCKVRFKFGQIIWSKQIIWKASGFLSKLVKLYDIFFQKGTFLLYLTEVRGLRLKMQLSIYFGLLLPNKISIIYSFWT